VTTDGAEVAPAFLTVRPQQPTAQDDCSRSLFRPPTCMACVTSRESGGPAACTGISRTHALHNAQPWPRRPPADPGRVAPPAQVWAFCRAVLETRLGWLGWLVVASCSSFRHLVGLGVEFIAEKGHFRVIAPIDGSPAARAGLKTNDFITQVDGVSVKGFTPDQLVLDKLIGPGGSQVRLTILRQGQDQPVELTLVREMTPLRGMRSRQEGGDIGYLRIPLMNEWTMPAYHSKPGPRLDPTRPFQYARELHVVAGWESTHPRRTPHTVWPFSGADQLRGHCSG
jgi:PDZ domain-containing protein